MPMAVTPDVLVPQYHPVRRIMPMVDKALAQLSPFFDRMYAQNGRASIPPDRMDSPAIVAKSAIVGSHERIARPLDKRPAMGFVVQVQAVVVSLCNAVKWPSICGIRLVCQHGVKGGGKTYHWGDA